MRTIGLLSLFTSAALFAACGGYTNLGDGPEAGAGGEDAGSAGSTSGRTGGGGKSAGKGGSMNSGGTHSMAGSPSPGSGGAVANAGTMNIPLPAGCIGLPCGSRCPLDLGMYPEMAGMNPGMGMGTPAGAGETGSGDLSVVLGYCADDGSCGPAFPICSGTQCTTDGDCPALPALCGACPDGLISCPSNKCVDGVCRLDAPGCSNECSTSADCAVSSAPCQMCPDGKSSCPRVECSMGRCVSSVPGCGGYDPCEGLACGEPCRACAPNDMNCGAVPPSVLSFCNDQGACQTGAPMCAPGDECKSAMDCPAIESCHMCASGGCGVIDCVNGKCGPTCPDDPEPECKVTADCGTPPPICTPCADGSCEQMTCLEGQCKMVCNSVQMCSNDDQCPSCGACGNDDACVPYECVDGFCTLDCAD